MTKGTEDGTSLHSLPLFCRVAGRRVVVVGEGPMAEAKARLVERAGAEVSRETEAHHARLAFVALDDARSAEAAAIRLRGKGLLVNVADRPDLCDFTLPSILERGPVLIAVSTGGASAGLAKHLRLRLERLLPQTLGTLAQGLAHAKDTLRRRFPNAEDRRAALDDALAEHGPLDPLDDASAAHLENWLEDSDTPPGGTVHEFTLVSDDPDDLTLRQARLLGVADLILHDPAIAAAILGRARADAERAPIGNRAPAERGVTLILRRQKPAQTT